MDGGQVADGDRSTVAGRFPLVVAAAVVLLTVGITIVRVVSPSDGGGHVDGDVFSSLGLTVDPPDPGATALESGMVVESIDGVTVRDMLGGARPTSPERVGSEHSYRVFDGERVRDIEVRLVEPRLGRALGGIASFLWFIGTIGVVAGYTVLRRPREPAAVALMAFAVCLLSAAVLSVAALEPADLAFRPVLWWASVGVSVLAFTAYLGSLAHLCLEFPRPPGWFERRPGLVPAVYLGPFLLGVVLVVLEVAPGDATTDGLLAATDVPALAALALVVVGLGNVVVNLVRARQDRTTRRDLAIVGLALVISLVGFVGLNLVSSLASLEPPDWAFLGMLVPLPVGVAFAVLRRGLFDLDQVVTRTIAYVLSSAVLVVLYVAAVAGLEATLRISERSATAPAVALVAVAFAPLRARAQRVIDRVMFGRRDDPYAVLTDVARGLQVSGAPLQGLERLTAAVAGALRLPWAAVVLQGEGEPVVTTGRRPEEVDRVPILHRGEEVGALEVGRRSPGEVLSRPDLRLLDAVASQAAIAVDALRLSDALARSRARAITAAEDERQRIRRDLHDGLGPALAGISLQLSVAEEEMDPEDGAYDAVSAALVAVGGAKAEVRRMIDGMAPPQLERLGLLAALRAVADQMNADPAIGSRGHPRIGVEGPVSLHAPPEVEVAAYRIAAEAVLNARRHARATTCSVYVSETPNVLRIDITDDGDGLDPDLAPPSAVGLASMRARTEDLGGDFSITTSGTGTTVTASIPTGSEGRDE